ncbi:hypothetical protein IVB69_02265 [Flavobacterium sp. J49]|uniref:hypothetical protein n=1 Tax=Flavobacterium sp. J49 TaxID=2718534 RepID=UPI0015937E50|nr:hypothetical protein [Flavobacterium sp. J49]MBF6640296.1 hypothetical protein [Flavobacterium sp. J49]NIC01541.1 hypothetical protein [Flavobacterium sp. J49]
MFCFLALVSCSSKKLEEKPTYTITDGLKLKYEIKTKSNGKLYINDGRDSILFNYKVVKTKLKVIDAESNKYKRIIMFEYHIKYLGEKFKNYPVLENYLVLPTQKRKKIFEYHDHNLHSK